MRKHTWDQRRDATVHLLARLSLVAALAVLGALFVGGAATSQASESSVTAGNQAGASESLHDRARPAGLLLGAAVVAGGLVVLTIGAAKPSAKREHRRYADLP